MTTAEILRSVLNGEVINTSLQSGDDSVLKIRLCIYNPSNVDYVTVTTTTEL